jgi:hypothetical protein
MIVATILVESENSQFLISGLGTSKEQAKESLIKKISSYDFKLLSKKVNYKKLNS